MTEFDKQSIVQYQTHLLARGYNNQIIKTMPEEKFHVGQDYKVISAQKMRSDGPGKPRAIICQLQIENSTDHPARPRSFVVWQNQNPKLYNELARGIRINQMPTLSGVSVVINSSACYYNSNATE